MQDGVVPVNLVLLVTILVGGNSGHIGTFSYVLYAHVLCCSHFNQKEFEIVAFSL